MDGAKVSVLNCDFGQTELTETVVSCTGSDLTVLGCYLQGIQVRLLGLRGDRGMRCVVTGGAGGERDQPGGGGQPQVRGEDRGQLHLQDGHRGLGPQLRHHMLQVQTECILKCHLTVDYFQEPDLQLLPALLPGSQLQQSRAVQRGGGQGAGPGEARDRWG